MKEKTSKWTSYMKTRVLIVEDSVSLGESLRCVVDWTQKFLVVGCCLSGEEALSRLKELKPEIVLLDSGLPGMDGIECCRLIRAAYPHLPVIILSDDDENEQCFAAFRSGAYGYLKKHSNYVKIIRGMEEVLNGGVALSRTVARKVVNKFWLATDSPLSQRQTEVLRFLAQGKTYIEIAECLNISRETSRSHIKSIYSKLNVHSRSDAISYAYENKLI